MQIDRSRDSSDLGIGVDHSDQRTLLLVSIEPHGVFGRWNVLNAHSAINVGDRIVAVNGISCHAEAMLKECQKLQVLNITIERGGAHGHSQAVLLQAQHMNVPQLVTSPSMVRSMSPLPTSYANVLSLQLMRPTY